MNYSEVIPVRRVQAAAEAENVLDVRLRHARAVSEAENILDVRDLNVAFRTAAGTVHAVRDVSFSVRRGETLALVGETSSGKSVTCLGLLGLTPSAPYCTISGSARLAARDGKTYELVGTPERVMRQVRGRAASVIFQEPMTSLNPVHTVGAQICESLRIHLDMNTRAATDRAAELLNQVGISDPKRRLANYPHELSGGMRQRVMIAMAIACEPSLLIADEPTTALDVTIQAQILELLQKLQSQTRMAMIYITHNLGTVAEIADRVMVMYAGRIVEQADVVELFTQPRHPYSRALSTRFRGFIRIVPAKHRCSRFPATCPIRPRTRRAAPLGRAVATSNRAAAMPLRRTWRTPSRAIWCDASVGRKLKEPRDAAATTTCSRLVASRGLAQVVPAGRRLAWQTGAERQGSQRCQL